MFLRIGIVGCGPAGQAASIFLARAGHAVDVYEQADRVGAAGAGFLVQPTGLAALRALGVADALRTLATPINRLRGTTRSGRTVLDVKYRDLHPSLQGFGMQRSAMSAALLTEMNSANVSLFENRRVTRIMHAPQQTEMTVRIETEQGERPDPYDLVILADGARSACRSDALPKTHVKRANLYPWGALWWMTTKLGELRDDELRQVYHGSRQMIGFLPSGRSGIDDTPKMSCFWSLPASHWNGSDRFNLDAWKSEAIALAPLAEPAINDIHSTEQLVYAPYYDVVLKRPYSGRVAVIGDAAHAMSPQLGQGVNLGLVDAASLADALAQSPSIDAALKRYTRDRHAQTRYYQRLSRMLTPVFQSGLPGIGTLRDIGLGPACRFSLSKREMLLALAGLKTGILRSNPIDTFVN